ncbi:MAG: aminoacyl-tRNA hydrolase [bacterium]|nr:aminoacyl-tRNA hydrolase [bacterium]
MKLIAGLGNPGDKYSNNRHNIGFMVIDALGARHGIRVVTNKKKSLTGSGIVAEEKVMMTKPQTFMNLSGEALGPLFSFLDIEFEDVIVVHDDLDLDFGRIKIKIGGGHGGHNGIRSIISHFGDKNFVRVRVGIGKPPVGWDVSRYVLNPFSADEKKELDDLLERAADAIETIISAGYLKAMNDFN